MTSGSDRRAARRQRRHLRLVQPYHRPAEPVRPVLSARTVAVLRAAGLWWREDADR